MFNNIVIDGRDFTIPTWDMTKQLQNQNVIMPILKEPVVNALAFASEENVNESVFIAAVLDGVMEALATVDMLKLAEILLDGVAIRSAESGRMVPASVKVLEAEGMDISTVLTLCIHVIKDNYGALLKKGFSGSLVALMGDNQPKS